MLSFWWQRFEGLVQDSRRVVPVALREKPPEYKVLIFEPVLVCLCNGEIVIELVMVELSS